MIDGIKHLIIALLVTKGLGSNAASAYKANSSDLNETNGVDDGLGHHFGRNRVGGGRLCAERPGARVPGCPM